jgi:hypothetical protein
MVTAWTLLAISHLNPVFPTVLADSAKDGPETSGTASISKSFCKGAEPLP